MPPGKEKLGLLAISHLCGIAQNRRENRILVMYRGFIDDSEQGTLFLLAGWVSDYKTWDAFTTEWRMALDAHPKIEYFKHHEAKSDPPSEQFAGWAKDDIDAKIAKLTDVICRFDMYGVISFLDMSIFNSALSGSMVPFKLLRTFFKQMHHFNNCVYNTSAWFYRYS